MKNVVSLLAGISWWAVSLMVTLNPSNTIPQNMSSPLTDIVLFLLVPVSLMISFSFIFKVKGRVSFFIHFSGLLLLLTVVVLWAAEVSHRDYHTLLFQYLLLMVTVLLLQIPRLGIVYNKKRIYRGIGYAAAAVFVAFSFWLVLMGYAIVTRAELRWIEATVYNFFGALILLVMLFSSVSLQNQAYRVLARFGDSLVWEERNISVSFSKCELHVLFAFLDHLDSCSCQKIITVISQEQNSETPDCGTCHRQGFSAINCGSFRKAKKYMSVLKKALELLGAGTIVPVSENYRNIKECGWQVRFFDDVIYRNRPYH